MMDDRELFDVLRKRARLLLATSAKALADPESSDGKMAPHVAKSEIEKLGPLGEKLIAMAQLAKVLP
jgi:hypothetical protein